MYKDKLKQELFEKIRKYREIDKERSKMEKEYSDLSILELDESNDEYAGLCVQAMDLQEEIDELIIDTKYAPLVGLTGSQIKESDFFMKSSDLSFEQNIEKHLDINLLKLKEEMKKRLKQIKTLRLSASIDQHMYNLYNQVVRCYVYGAFEASCVLCRAIAEFISKEYIILKKLGHLLPSKSRSDQETSIFQILKKKLSCSKEIPDLYYEIKAKANNILHEKEEVTKEQDALYMIRQLQLFIKNFPKVA